MLIKLKYIELFNTIEKHLVGLFEQFNRPSRQYELGFNTASHSGRNLALWRKQKKELEKVLDHIQSELQLSLDLEQ